MFLRFLLVLFLVAPVSGQDKISGQDKKFPTFEEIEKRYGSEVEIHLDQPYAGNSNPRQMLDFYLPKKRINDKPLPVVVTIHGGAWRGGDRKGTSGVAAYASTGNYAGVAVGYRLSDEVKWPAQIHDCKAVIRWIRGHAKEFNLDADHIGVQGSSAGGHLTSLLCLTGDIRELEGSVGEFTQLSSRIACAVNYCGPSDMTVPLMQGEAALEDDPAVTGLIGGSLKVKLDAAKAASPITYIRAGTPPLMIVHGTLDQRVNYSHAVTLDAALKKVGAPSTLIEVTGSGHGIQGGQELSDRVRQFFDLHLRGVKAEISDKPIPAQTSTSPQKQDK